MTASPIRQNLAKFQSSAAALAALRQYWGYDQFRPGQEAIVQALIDGQDVLAIMPTGSGKSLCFQIPSLCRSGLTLVISPLIALMEDQVADLKKRGIAAEALHSQRSRGERSQIVSSLPRLSLLYLSPETLLSPAFWPRLLDPKLTLAALIIDEAHCLTQWGNSFRPAYSRLGAVRQALMTVQSGPAFPVAAFTATADRATRDALVSSLQLKSPYRSVRSPHRPHLKLQVKRIWTARQRRQQALAFLCRQVPITSRPHALHNAMPSGLIYVRNRRDSEALAKLCGSQGWKTAAYHGGLSAQRRRQIEQAWLAGAQGGGLPFVVCTSAFGMGIDLPNCRWILHYHLPLLLSEYVQEIGRAGRDGQPAIALALASEPSGWLDPSDRQRNQRFLTRLAQQQHLALALAKQLPSQGSLRDAQQKHAKAPLALALLHRLGQLYWNGPHHYQLNLTSSHPTLHQSLNTTSMQTYLRHSDQAWPFIIEAFQ